MTTYKTKPITIIFLILIIILAFFLRIWGINFGFPKITHNDEHTIVEHAYAVAQGNLHFIKLAYAYPASPQVYLLSLTYRPIFKIHNLFSKNKISIKDSYQKNIVPIHLAGRILTLLISLLTIYLIFKLGKYLFSENIGLLSAFFLAINPLDVEHSHFITPDVALSFFLLLTLYFVIRFLKEENHLFIYIASIFCGLATATKYPGLIAILFIILAIAIYQKREIKKFTIKTSIIKIFFNKTIWLCFLIILIVFSLITPFFWFDLKDNVIPALQFESRSIHEGVSGHSGLNYFQRLTYYIFDAFGQRSIGLFAIFGWIGLALVLLSKKAEKILIGISFLIFILLISCLKLNWERWVVSVIPIFCLFMAISIQKIAYFLKEKSLNCYSYKKILFYCFRISFIILIIFISSLSLINDIRINLYLECNGQVNFYDRRFEITNLNLQKLQCPKTRWNIVPKHWKLNLEEKIIYWLGIPIDSNSLRT